VPLNLAINTDPDMPVAAQIGTLSLLILLIHWLPRHCGNLAIMGTKGAKLETMGPNGFGWLLRGRPVDLLEDRSLDLAASPDGSFLKPYCLDVATLQSCLQCGACTATCELAGEEGLFPRRQVAFVRLGLQDRLVTDQQIWHCYGCTECSTQCPSNAKPASIMSALRQFATDRFACPRVLARVVNDWRSFWLVYAGIAAFLAALIALTGAFSPPLGLSGTQA